jgi:hypothetical protein
VLDFVTSVGDIGAAATEPAFCEATEVAAVEMRAMLPELVDDEVSLRRSNPSVVGE